MKRGSSSQRWRAVRQDGMRQRQTQKSNCSTRHTGSAVPHFSDRKIEATLKLRRGCFGVGALGKLETGDGVCMIKIYRIHDWNS